MTSPDQTTATKCANCEATIAGKYCSNCGQPTFPLQMPLGVFLKAAAHEIFALDSRVFRTLGPLLFKPGHVTSDYVSGHRVKYVPPFRLYIILSFCLFLLLALVQNNSSSFVTISEDSDDTTDVDVAAVLDSTLGDIPLDSIPGLEVLGALAGDSTEMGTDSLVESIVSTIPLEGLDSTEDADSVDGILGEFITRAERIAEDPDEFLDDFRHRMAQAMFFLLPVFALLLKVLYRKRFYVEHLVFSIYFHCFVYTLVFLVTIIGLVSGGGEDTIADLLLLSIPLYLVVGMKKVYQQGYGKTLVKAAILGFSHLTIVGLTLLVVLLGTLWLF